MAPIEPLSNMGTQAAECFRILSVQLDEFTLFHLQKKERPVQRAVRSESGRSGERGQCSLGHEKFLQRFAGGDAAADPVDDRSGCIVSLHREERGGGLESLLIALHKFLHGGVGAVYKKSVDEGGAFDCSIRGAGEILRIPSVRSEQRDAHVMECQLCGDQPDVFGAAGDEYRIESRCVQDPFILSIERFSCRPRRIDRNGEPVLFEVLGFELRDRRTEVGVSFVEGDGGNDFSLMLPDLLREEPRKFPAVNRIGVEDAEPPIALFLRGIGCNAFSLQTVGERGAEQLGAQPADIGQGGSRGNERHSGPLRHFRHDREILGQHGADHCERAVFSEQR